MTALFVQTGPIAASIGRKKEITKFVRASSQFVNVGDVPALSFERTNSFSLACWFRTSFTGFLQVLMSKTMTAVFRGYEFRIGPTGLMGMRIDNTFMANGVSCDFNTASLADGAWHHGVVTYDGSSAVAGIKGYVDGTLKSNTNTVDALSATIITTAPFRLGAHSSAFLDGKLDECAVYNKALSSGEVTTIYHGGVVANLSAIGPTGNLVGYWRMGEGATFPIIPDLGSGGNVGTMTNMARGAIGNR